MYELHIYCSSHNSSGPSLMKHFTISWSSRADGRSWGDIWGGTKFWKVYQLAILAAIILYEMRPGATTCIWCKFLWTFAKSVIANFYYSFYIQIHILRQVQEAEKNRQAETHWQVLLGAGRLEAIQVDIDRWPCGNRRVPWRDCIAAWLPWPSPLSALATLLPLSPIVTPPRHLFAPVLEVPRPLEH